MDPTDVKEDEVDHDEVGGVGRLLQCESCSYVSHSQENLRKHRETHLIPEVLSEVKCEHCDYVYSYSLSLAKSSRRAQQQLNGHMNEEHMDLKLKCPHCEKSFWTEKQLETHLQNHQYTPTAEGDYQCEHCDYRCRKISRLKFHINSVHLGVRPHLCDFCPAAFPTKGALNAHRRSHTGERNFPCMICEKKFQSKHNLLTHVRTHTGEKPFTCDVCGKSFGDQAYFANHKRTHATDGSGNRVKDFSCDICNKSFTRRTYLKYHMTLHEAGNEGRAAKYSHEFKLTAIERTKEVGLPQTAEEMKINMSTLKGWIQLTVHPHSCHLCDKAFPFNAQLKKHLLTHPEYKQKAGLLTVDVKQPSQRYEDSFRREVAMFAIEKSIQEATVKFNIAHSTINYWVKMVKDPRPCHICGKEFANDSTVRRHIEQVHKNTPDGLIEQERKVQEQSVNQQTFSMYLADHDMLPDQMEVRAKEEEKERRVIEKKELAPIAKEIFEKEKERWKEIRLKKGAERLQRRKNRSNQEVEFRNESTKTASNNTEEFSIKSEEPSDAECEDDDIFEPNLFEPNTCLQTQDQEDDEEAEENGVHNDGDSLKEEQEEVNVVKRESEENLNEIDDDVGSDEEMAVSESSYCKKEVSSRRNVEYHKRESVTNCQFCGSQFSEGVKLREHQLRKHPLLLEQETGEPIVRYPCELCHRSFNVKRDLGRHSKRSHGPRVPAEYKHMCDICGKKFTRLSYLKTHEAKVHSVGKVGLQRFPCEHCDQVYHVRDHLNRHVRVIHEKERISCELCGKLFRDRSALVRHQLYHGEPRFQCDECPEKFREGRHLKRHKRVHAGEIQDERTCEFCSKTFTSLHSLRNHQVIYHVDSGEKGTAECRECGREYRNRKLLKAHMRIHSKDYINQKYCCHLCGNEYKSNVSLTNHIKTIHMGQRDFPCDVCGKLFTRANTLRTHRKIHSGIKQFHCIYCESTYGEKRNLMNHIAKNHPDCEQKFRKITESGSVIMDDKNNTINQDEDAIGNTGEGSVSNVSQSSYLTPPSSSSGYVHWVSSVKTSNVTK